MEIEEEQEDEEEWIASWDGWNFDGGKRNSKGKAEKEEKKGLKRALEEIG